jgi:hypothetical protein
MCAQVRPLGLPTAIFKPRQAQGYLSVLAGPQYYIKTERPPVNLAR